MHNSAKVHHIYFHCSILLHKCQYLSAIFCKFGVFLAPFIVIFTILFCCVSKLSIYYLAFIVSLKCLPSSCVVAAFITTVIRTGPASAVTIGPHVRAPTPVLKTVSTSASVHLVSTRPTAATSTVTGAFLSAA